MLGCDGCQDASDAADPLTSATEEGGSCQKRVWTRHNGEKLQQAVDSVFGVAGQALKGLQFSLTLADPLLEGCPLIGCSTGFGRLCGYEMDEIVGRNCRFLVDPVPEKLVNENVRRWSWQFCNAAKEDCNFSIPEGELEPWMPAAKSAGDGIFCAQMNARKDGSLFENLFYLRCFSLNDQPYIAGLQTELPAGCLGGVDGTAEKEEALIACHQACRLLDANWMELERVLASMFWFMGPMRRQDDADPDDGFTEMVDLPGKVAMEYAAETRDDHHKVPEFQVCLELDGTDEKKDKHAEEAACKAPLSWVNFKCCWPQKSYATPR